MVSPAVTLKVMPCGPGWCPRKKSRMQTHSPESGWEATKERADLGVGARVHSFVRSFVRSFNQTQEALVIALGGGETVEKRASASLLGGGWTQ